MSATRSFEGFPPDALAFFDRLSANNTREWFHANKPEYESVVKDPMVDLLIDLSDELGRRGLPLSADPKKAIFRINRDVRFAKDKSPYKTNIAACVTRDGEKHAPGMLYIQIAPAGSFVGAGFYELDAPELDAFRQRMVAAPANWDRVERSLKVGGVELATEGALKKLPRGYDQAVSNEIGEALKLKMFVTKRWLDPDELSTSSLVEKIADFAALNRPLLEFGWAAIGDVVADVD